jgi:hypothetical protein
MGFEPTKLAWVERFYSHTMQHGAKRYHGMPCLEKRFVASYGLLLHDVVPSNRD